MYKQQHFIIHITSNGSPPYCYFYAYCTTSIAYNLFQQSADLGSYLQTIFFNYIVIVNFFFVVLFAACARGYVLGAIHADGWSLAYGQGISYLTIFYCSHFSFHSGKALSTTISSGHKEDLQHDF